MKKIAVLVFIGSFLGVSVAMAAPPDCNSIVFVGKLEWTKLYPRREFVSKSLDRSGNQEIYTTNSCGTVETRFDITDLLVGPSMSSLTVNSKLGEQCRPPVPFSRDSILVSAVKKGGEWVMGAVAPVTKDQAGATLILPDYSKDFLGVSTDSVRKTLEHPIYIAEAANVPKAYISVMEKRGVLKQFGTQLYYVTGVYISDLHKALNQELALRSQQCVSAGSH
jgi:hypothetical protein